MKIQTFFEPDYKLIDFNYFGIQFFKRTLNEKNGFLIFTSKEWILKEKDEFQKNGIWSNDPVPI